MSLFSAGLPKEQEDLQVAHEGGEHFGAPHPDCWSCWDLEDRDGDNPECPGDYA